MSKEHKLHRVNTKIPSDLNDWLDDESSRTGIAKSSLIMLAVQAYHDQKMTMERIDGMGELARQMKEVQQALERHEQD